MKITIVQGAFLPVPPLRGGAVEKIWFALGNEFVRRGHTVTHFSRSFPGLPEKEIVDGVQHLRVSGFDAPRSLALLKLFDLIYSLRIVRRLPPGDIVVTNTFWLPILIRSARAGKLYVHVARLPRGQMKFYRHAARLQGVSSLVMSAILDEVPEMKDRVNFIGNPVAPGGATSMIARRKEILYVGRLHPEKGVHLLIDALRRLPQERLSDWKLVIVGPSEANAGGGGPDYEAELRRLAAPLGSRVAFVGAVYDPARLSEHYAAASLFVYPSLAEFGETFGLAPLEAMAHGCPPLVSDLACFRDFVLESKNGFVFDHRAESVANVLARRIDQLLTTPALLSAAGAEGICTAARFSVERIAEKYLRDFQSLVDPGYIPTP